MNPEDTKALLDEFTKQIDETILPSIEKAVGETAAKKVGEMVKELRLQREIYGKDITGLDAETKKAFAEGAASIAGGKFKANEAFIESNTGRGGYLVADEIADAILRVMASVGLALSQATTWEMGSMTKKIPTYVGAFLEGEYLTDDDTAGSVTNSASMFSQSVLTAKVWQLAFALSNSLLEDASVDLADWLISLAAEAQANMIDKQVFIGSGAPFTGVLNKSGVTVQIMATTKTGFDKFDIDEASDAVGKLEESLLDGAAWYFHRTVWAKIRVKKDTTGQPIFSQFNNSFGSSDRGSGIKSTGTIFEYPVFTVRHLPAFSASAISTKFAIFGNLKAVSFGKRRDFTLSQYTSGTFGGKEIALADQTAMIFRARHAVDVSLPSAFVVLQTSAS